MNLVTRPVRHPTLDRPLEPPMDVAPELTAGRGPDRSNHAWASQAGRIAGLLLQRAGPPTARPQGDGQ